MRNNKDNINHKKQDAIKLWMNKRTESIIEQLFSGYVGNCLKWTYGLSGNDYRVDMLSKMFMNHHAKFEINRTMSKLN